VLGVQVTVIAQRTIKNTAINKKMNFNLKIMKPEVVFIILGLVLLVTLIYFNKPATEGFAGTVASTTETSMIPKDTPGATSTNPTASKPQARDIEDIQERLKNFVLLTESKYPRDTNLPTDDLASVMKLLSDAPGLKGKLTAALANFDTSGFTVGEFAGLRARIDSATEKLRGASSTALPAKPTAVQGALTLLNKFADLATQKRPENTNLPSAQKSDIMALRDSVPDLEQRLLAALAKSDASGFSATRVEELTAQIATSTALLKDAEVVGSGAGRQVEPVVAIPKPTDDATYAAVIAKEPAPTVVAGPVGVITVAQLKDLVSRIQEEHLRLSNLRSTAPSIVTRIQQLEALKANVAEFVTKVELKQMKLEDVPITPDAANSFLSSLKSDSEPVPPLIVPAGSMPGAIKAPNGIAEYAGIPAGEQAVQQLLTAARDLRWSMEVRLEYDPHLKTREAMLGRLENIIRNLQTLSVSESAIPPKIHDSYLKELHSIQGQLKAQPATTSGGGDVGPMSRLPTGYTRVPTGAPEPNQEAVAMAQGAGFGPQANTFPHGEVSPDVYIRPGFVMNDRQIERRGSAASFEPSSVPGPDYKARALEICRQIKSGALGDTASFGCIANPDEVGPTYNWKGNYTMVCNRLGDSWGRNYPAQFGCPPYDPTAKFSSGF
jgi:hypothetical protein